MSAERAYVPHPWDEYAERMARGAQTVEQAAKLAHEERTADLKRELEDIRERIDDYQQYLDEAHEEENRILGELEDIGEPEP